MGLRKPHKEPFTWDDYRDFPDDECWEIIRGEAFAMTPAPSTRHQEIVMELAGEMRSHFKGGRCKVYPSPTDVKLSDTDIVQPDILVVCDSTQIKKTHIDGPPSLVIEIISPSSSLHDRGRKLELYGRSGVREVWLVTPYPSLIEVLVLDGDSYRIKHSYVKEDTLSSPSFPDLAIELASIFDFPIDPEEEIQLIKERRPSYG